MTLMHTQKPQRAICTTAVATLIAIFCVCILQSSTLMAASGAAAPDGFEAGVAAFHRGDFAAARGSIAIYTRHPDKRLSAEAYIFAMQDTKPVDPWLAPSGDLKDFIVAQADVDPLYKALSAKLHLMGYHRESNLQVGLMDLAGLGEVHGNAYALYTLGLYHEGVFTVPPTPANLMKAKLKYEEARAAGHRAAMERFNAVERLLNPEPEGGWEGEDDSVSQLGDRLGEMPAWNPRAAGQNTRGGRGGASVAPSMRTQQTGSRFYGGASVVSGVSADSEAPRGAGAARPISRAAAIAAQEEALARAAAAEAALATERQAAAARITQLEAAAVQREQEATRHEAAVAAERARAAQLETALAEARAAIVPIPPVIPAIATGHEAFYQRFLAGRLEYRPTPGSDAGLVVLPIADLLRPIASSANPLSATFDLSRCGDAGEYLSINIGYKKAKVPGKDNKLEVWLCPQFLAEHERPASLAPIMGQWEAPLGYFWTWGGWEARSDNYDYLTSGSAMQNDKNIYEKWRDDAHHYFVITKQPYPNWYNSTSKSGWYSPFTAEVRSNLQNFHLK
jgi:hypothetical protein